MAPDSAIRRLKEPLHIVLLHQTKPDTVPEGVPPDIYMELETVEEIEEIASCLESLGHTVRLINSIRDPLPQLFEARGTVDLVFSYAVGFGTRSREITPAALCEALELRYSGSNPITLAVASNKQVCKMMVEEEGVATPSAWLATTLDDLDEIWKSTDADVVLKPNYEGSSIGVRGPFSAAQREAAEQVAAQVFEDYQQSILVEEFVSGYEVTVPVLEPCSPDTIRPLALEIDGSILIGDRIYDSALKASRTGHAWIADPDLPADTLRTLSEWALKAHQRLGCRDFSRSDFRVSREFRPFFLELNPSPRLSEAFCRGANVPGHALTAVLDQIIEHARKRPPPTTHVIPSTTAR